MDKILKERLAFIYEWYKGMVNEETGRLVYIYSPSTDSVVANGSPIRDIGAIWDMEILSGFLDRKELEPVIERSLNYYSRYLLRRNGYVILDPKLLDEPSGIAHNAFMTLSLLHSRLPDKEEKALLLADGILAQQRPDGSFKIYFGAERDDGLDFYPGEAMLALLEMYKMTKIKKYLESAEQGFVYYKTRYYERKKVRSGLLIFFANWQSQFCRLLYTYTQKEELRRQVKDYVFQLHDRIIERNDYGKVKRYPEKQVSVEVACALEGLNDAYAIALQEMDDRRERYQGPLCISLTYLLSLQCVKRCTDRQRGGFGFSLSDRTQRIDITGHFVNGLIKSFYNEITC